MKTSLPPLNEYGFLPVPPTIHEVSLDAMPGCFGVKPWRNDLWNNCVAFFDWLRSQTPVREVYVDGRFLSASDEVDTIEVGIELTPTLIKKAGGFNVFNLPAREEFGIRVRFFGPHRPQQHNFHEEFNTPDPEIRLRGAPHNLRKGYVRIKL